MGVNSDNFSTYPEDNAENVSALEQLIENHDKDSNAHSEQFDNLLKEIEETGAFYGTAKSEVLDASKDAKESAQRAKTSEEGAKRSAEACDDAAERVAQMVSGVEADKQDILLLKASAENFAKVSEKGAKEVTRSAKNMHPKIIDGVWWVYDASIGEMVSSGVPAYGGDGYTPQRGVDYWTAADINKIEAYIINTINAINIHGKFNEIDKEGKYAHIVGGGTSEEDRENIHTIDWDGNAVFAGNVTFNYNGKNYNLGQALEGLEDLTNVIDGNEVAY